VPRDHRRINRCFVFITICKKFHHLICIQRQSKLCLYIFKTLFLIPLRKRGIKGDLKGINLPWPLFFKEGKLFVFLFIPLRKRGKEGDLSYFFFKME